MDLLYPLMAILLGVVAMALYVTGASLKMALRQNTRLSNRLAEMNERLMVLLGTRDGGDAVGRALVASARAPKKTIPGVAPQKKESKKEAEPVHMETRGFN